MTDISKLRELLERVESATGRDYELDRAISKELLGAPSLTPITSSIDAAISLCEHMLPGWRMRWQHDGDGVHMAFLENMEDFCAICADATESFCASGALALCAAILRAKIAMIEKEAA